MEHTTRCVFEVTPGSFIAAGIVEDTIKGKTALKLRLFGLDSQGALLWSKAHGNEKYRFAPDYLVSRSFYKDGNHLFYAGLVIDSNDVFICTLTKFDLSGNQIWHKSLINPKGLILAHTVTKSTDGGLLVSADITDTIAAVHPGLLIKLDQAGNILWQKEFHKNAPDIIETRQLVQDSATKKIIIVGMQREYTQVNTEDYASVYITDSLGNEITRRTFGKGGMTDIIQTKDENFVVTGIRKADALGRVFPTIVKFGIDSLNFPRWRIDSLGIRSFSNHFWCLREMSNGDLFVAGNYDTMSSQNNFPNSLSRFTRFSSTGILLSNKYYNYGKDINAYNQQKVLTVELTSDGGWIAASWVIRQNSANFMQIVKYDANGCDSSLAYCSNRLGLSPYVFSDLQIYPQPANEELHIKTPLNDLVFELYDIYGRNIKIPDSRQVEDIYTLSLKQVPAGLYLLRISGPQGSAYIHKLLKD